MGRRLTDQDREDIKRMRELVYEQLEGKITREEFLAEQEKILSRQLRLAVQAGDREDGE
jgi:hypothetical protein